MKRYLFLFGSLITLHVNAQLRIDPYFSDNVVLQRNERIAVRGNAVPGQQVLLTLGNRHYVAACRMDSSWSVILPKTSSGGPYALTVKSGSQQVQVKNVVYGDVWFCSGQSNMRFRMEKVADHDIELADAGYPMIRQFEVGLETAIRPLQNIKKGKWLVADSATMDKFSAVAWYFAKAIYKKYGVPIGIIHASWGGSPIETFMSGAALHDFAVAQKKIDMLTPGFVSDTKAANQKLLENAAPGVSRPKGYVNVENGYPTMVYNAMIAPFFKYPVKGVVWYQGEANKYVPQCYDYEKMLFNLITTWRNSWQNPQLPFLITQLANFGKVSANPVASGWAVIQEAQARLAARLPYTALAVTLDIGDSLNIHYATKKLAGLRLALAARKIAYGEKDIVASGPVFSSLTIKDGTVELSFSNTGGALVAKGGGNQLNAFALAGYDGRFYRAMAHLDGDKVIVTSPRVPKPLYVRYAFESSPPQVNFYNKEGLPAVPFRTDKFTNAINTN